MFRFITQRGHGKMASLFRKKRKLHGKHSSLSPLTKEDEDRLLQEGSLVHPPPKSTKLLLLVNQSLPQILPSDHQSGTRRRGSSNDEHNATQGHEVSMSSSFLSETPSSNFPSLPIWSSFTDLGLAPPLVNTCRTLGFSRPTPVQRVLIPYLLRNRTSHVLALAATGSGKTAAFVLPILHHLVDDPYGIFCVVVTPTRELAKQIHQQVLALGSAYHIQSALVVGGMDSVQQSLTLDQKRPHICVGTPGRLAQLLRGPCPPKLNMVRYLVLDEADRLLAANSGFERDVAELLLHTRSISTTTTTHSITTSLENHHHHQGTRQQQRHHHHRHDVVCQTLLFSATMTRSLETMEELAGAGQGRLPLQKFVIAEDKMSQQEQQPKHHDDKASINEKKRNAGDDTTVAGTNTDCYEDTRTNETDVNHPITPRIPAGLKQEYIFMPSRVRDAYLLTTIRTLVINGGRKRRDNNALDMESGRFQQKANRNRRFDDNDNDDDCSDNNDDNSSKKARSVIVFVDTCERAALVSGILDQLGVDNVALHSLLSQNRRLAALAKFKSEQVRVLVATDVASRGLDIPTVDLVINSELPRQPVSYIHRVGRTARAGRRGRAISLVTERDVALVHAVERMSGRPLIKCNHVTDDMAIRLLGPVTKAARLAKMKLADIGFDQLVQKFKERKARDRKERQRIERALQRSRVEQVFQDS